MRWGDLPAPVRMCRIAVVAPTRRWTEVLTAVGESGAVEPDPRPDAAGPGGTELDRVDAVAVRHGAATALAGWSPAAAVDRLRSRLAPLGGTVVEVPPPAGVDVPTALEPRRATTGLRPLVDTYATVPYRDVDPLAFAAVAYAVMFGMMFGDVGDGLLLVAGALWLRGRREGRFAPARRVWSLVAGMGVAATFFGLLYGEFFGPTEIIPTLWISPLDEPQQLLVAGVGVGALLLAWSYAIGIVNRWREGGPAAALWSSSGIAGATLFLGLGLVAVGIGWSRPTMWVAGSLLAAAGLALAAVGLRAAAGPGGAGAVQAGVETFDLTIRLGSNVVSFARLAAFGLMHAAIAAVVWDATTGLWSAGAAGAVAAVLVFVAGHVVAFALEALVAAVQALRLEYYELFSRIFVGEGRPFEPWRLESGREEAP